MFVLKLIVMAIIKISLYHADGQNIEPNGTAVEGVCVTGEAIRFLVPVVSSEAVPVASRYGAIFAITVRVGFITIAVQGDSY